MGELQITEAHTSFTHLARDTPGKRNVALGLGLSLLNLQPKVEGNIAKAQSIFEQLSRENPADDIGIQAQYFLARIEELHRFQPNRAEAILRYTELAKKYPAHLFGQIALVKRANLLIYSSDPKNGDKTEILQKLEEDAALFTYPAAARDYHTSMAIAYLRFADAPKRALEHLLKAEQAGVLRGSARSDLYIQIATLSDQQGYAAQATEYYRKFLANSRRDGRSFMVKQRIAELENAKQ